MTVQKPKNPKDRIILALDVDDFNEAKKLVRELKDYVGFFKVGLQLYTSVGSEIIEMIHDEGGKVFFDGKFHDIPNTVARASANLVKKGISFFAYFFTKKVREGEIEMARFNGFGGGGFNMQQMMRQAQKMQEQMAQAQEELAELSVTGSAGGGMVEITLSGKRDVESVSIKPEAVDPDDVEMLEDLIAAALGDALAKVEEKEKELMPYGAAGMM